MPQASHGAGFGINEHSARAMGMGGAFTGIADSPAAVFFNPAGLATLDGLSLEAGVTMIAPTNSYRGIAPGTSVETEVDGVSHLFWLPNLHASYRLHERVAVGLGVYVPYGLTVEWPESTTVAGQSVGWWGRSEIEKISLQTFFINPTVAVKVHPRVMVGAGLTVVPASVELRRAVALSADPAEDVKVNLAGTDVGFAATAGVLVKVLPELLNVGLSYRGGPQFTFTGDAAFTRNGSADAVPIGLRTQLTDGPVEAALDIPHVVSFGIGAFPIEGLNVGFNFDLITWSTYDELAVEFTENEDLSTTQVKDWKNTIAIRVGAEYHILPQLPVRLGFIFDQGPAPMTTVGLELPDSDRYEFTVGVGYKLGDLSIDAAYQYLTTGEFETAEVAPLPGIYRADAHLLGVSLAYALPL